LSDGGKCSIDFVDENFNLTIHNLLE